MNGVVLADMEVSDMLDVLHYMFEEDNSFADEQSFLAKSKLRSMIFRDMYNIKYKYEYEPPKKSAPAQPSYGTDLEDEYEWGTMEEDEALQPFNPRDQSMERKPPAQAPTEFDIDAENPFPGLEAPMR